MTAEWFVPIIVALIMGPVVVVLNKVRNENTVQHASSKNVLTVLVTKIDNLGTKLDTHIGWHEGQEATHFTRFHPVSHVDDPTETTPNKEPA